MKNFGTARERYTGPEKVPLPQRHRHPESRRGGIEGSPDGIFR